MAGAPYQFDQSFEMDATFEIDLNWILTDGVTIFPFASFLIEYALSFPNASPLWTLSSASGGGITTDPTTGNLVILKMTPGLAPGRYSHNCRITELATGKVIPVFDGTVTICTDAFL